MHHTHAVSQHNNNQNLRWYLVSCHDISKVFDILHIFIYLHTKKLLPKLPHSVPKQKVFTSSDTLLLLSGLPFTWQWRAGAPETAIVETGFQSVIFWNRNLLSSYNWQTAKPMTAVTMVLLMLMLAQVSAVYSTHWQTPIKHSTVHRNQVDYDTSLLRWIQVFIARF